MKIVIRRNKPSRRVLECFKNGQVKAASVADHNSRHMRSHHHQHTLKRALQNSSKAEIQNPHFGGDFGPQAGILSDLQELEGGVVCH